MQRAILIVDRKGHTWLRVICFFAALPSGAALLAKVYGVASMQSFTLVITLPCFLALIAIWFWAHQTRKFELSSSLTIGFLGGLLGTIGYDIARIPFALSGQRVFAPISTYGIWIAEAASSSRFTEAGGWVYHFSNGLTFGVMYSLFMTGRHWAWAIVWAFMLETIALVSPFGRIFSLTGNYYAMGIAYLGHIAYGLPLGWLVYRWSETRAQLAATPAAVKWMLVLVTCGLICWPLAVPENIRRDARAAPGEFRVEGARLNPDWLRINQNESIDVYNPGPESRAVRVKQTNANVVLANGEKQSFSFFRPGIYQVFVENLGRSQSSFVIVEPVEDLR